MKQHVCRLFFSTLFALMIFSQGHAAEIFLREKLSLAKKGDYIVTVHNKTYTVLTVQNKQDGMLVIEEISIPENKFTRTIQSWKQWVEKGAKHHTGWISYFVELPQGKIRDLYSHTQKCHYQVNENSNMFSTLLNLKFTPIPGRERRKKGSPNGGTTYWHPKMVVEGAAVPNIQFAAIRSRWPMDGSKLAGECVEIYLPEDSQHYPSYFPYWMQKSGTTHKLMRAIDSGTGLRSPRPEMFLTE